MSKFTSTLVLSLFTMGGAFAQVTTPTTRKSAEQLTSNAAASQKVFLKATSNTNENWFTGEISSATLSDKTLFELEKKDNAYVLKRVSTGNYIQPNEDQIQFGDKNTAQTFELVNVPKSNINDETLLGEEPYVRFKKSSATMYLNVQNKDWNPKFASGTGAWSVVHVYDASEYFLVTLNIQKEDGNTTVKQVYKTGDKIVPPTYEGFVTFTTATANSANQSVDVKYCRQASYYETVLQTQGKVGYPSDANLYNTLKSSIDKAKSESTEANYQAIETALNALYNATDVTLPTDGKTYVFTNHHKKNDGTIAQNYLKCTAAEGLTIVGRGDAVAENYPMEAKFTCHKLENNKFVFVNNLGKYLVLKGGNGAVGTNSNKGYVDAYDATFCPMTIKKHDHNDAKGKDLFGLVSFGGRRMDSGNNTNKSSYFIIKFDNSSFSFDQTLDFTFYNTNTHSSVFQIEEVAYPNNPTLKAIEGNAVSINGAKSIATFSAPFATTLPQGVSAFYAKQTTQDNTVELELLTGNVVPANTGVILTSGDTEKSVVMVPAIQAATDNIQNNQLGHSAGADKTFQDANFYILGKSGNDVGFFKGQASTTLKMNKAYLQSNATAGALKIIFGGKPGDGTTGIEGVEEQGNAAAAPIYDLSGRRVASPVKGGLYIQNGKKIIVK